MAALVLQAIKIVLFWHRKCIFASGKIFFGMKKTLIVLFVAAFTAVSAQGQSIRCNYRSNGMTHISTAYESLELSGTPAEARVELAGFPDGSALYVLYLNLLQKTATVVPKGVKMGVTLSSGKIIRLDQIGQFSATPPRLENGLFVNRLKYAVEPADMEMMVRGIKGVDIITGWNPEDFIQGNFAADEMGSLLKRHCEAILAASERTIDLEAQLSGYTDNVNSILSTTNPVVARGENFAYNIIVSHLYYKNTNEEDVDLAFVLGAEKKYHIPLDSPVRFTLRDGSVIELLQTREDDNFVYVYPSMEEMARLCSAGIASLSVDYEGGVLQDRFTEENGFSEAVNQQVQLLLSLSPR